MKKRYKESKEERNIPQTIKKGSLSGWSRLE
jgi:hypothetical protein